MAEVTNDLIDEVLKSIQARLGHVEDGIREIRTELVAVRTHMSAVQLDIGNLYQSVASVDARTARMERRLDLVDSPVK